MKSLAVYLNNKCKEEFLQEAGNLHPKRSTSHEISELPLYVLLDAPKKSSSLPLWRIVCFLFDGCSAGLLGVEDVLDLVFTPTRTSKHGFLELPNKKIGNLLPVRPPFGVAHDAVELQVYSQYRSKDRCRASPYPWWLHYANAIENQREEVIQNVAATDYQNASRVELELVVPDDHSNAKIEEIIQDVAPTDHQTAAQVHVRVAEKLVVPGDQIGAQVVEFIQDVAPTDHQTAAQVNVTVAEKLVIPDDQTGAKVENNIQDVAPTDHQTAAQVNITIAEVVVPVDQTAAQLEKIIHNISATDLTPAKGNVKVAEVVDAQNHVATETHVRNAGRVTSESSTSLATKIKAIEKMLPTFTNMSEMIIDMQEIASGSYGRVYMTTTKMGKIAVKTLKTEKMATLTLDQVNMYVYKLYEEAQLLSSLRHPNILSFYMMIPKFDKGFPGMAMELMSESCLYTCLQRGDERVRSWFGILNIAQQVVEAMMYLHEHRIVHFDLKSCNILVEYDSSRPNFPICKLGDFGAAMVQKPHHNGRIPITSDRGTVMYMAPEVILAGCRPNQITFVTEKVDVFSFGMLMWELFMGDVPYGGMPYEQVAFGVAQEGMRPDLPEQCNRGWVELMTDCWAQDEIRRPTFNQIRIRLNDMVLLYNRKISMNRRRARFK